eukprot:NODE_5077_length_1811_cov_1.978029.p1 GENE.NODE_5077_length_1811_cov_1.978029~~NODE_5077_length_1811_cov_1.978029.p1  ORF type:complete len:529 (+),score=96.22 NODE_5077_length_1811_cov_1.978029:22-1608(+)
MYSAVSTQSTWGWLTPRVHLLRPAHLHPESSLMEVLGRRAERGVQVFVVLFRENAAVMYNDSYGVEEVLCNRHNNIHVVRHPNTVGLFFGWSHHEKVCLVDEKIGFVGGIDLCIGRYETKEHRLADDTGHPTLYPGNDYCNPTIRDFHNGKEVRQIDHDFLNRRAQTRMPWHDVSVQLHGPICRDLARHFMQVWTHARSDFKRHSMAMVEASGMEEVDQGLPALSGELPQPRWRGSRREALDGAMARAEKFRTAVVGHIRSFNGVRSNAGMPGASACVEMSSRNTMARVRSLETLEPDESGKVLARSVSVIDEFRQHHTDTDNDSDDPLSSKSRPARRMFASVPSLHVEASMGPATSDASSSVTPPRIPMTDTKTVISKHTLSNMILVDSEPPPVTVQLLRSASSWSYGTSHIEQSIQNAYLKVISKAEHYIFIENQFFITSSHRSARDGRDAEIINRIGEKIVARIIRAAQENKVFRVYIIMPALPGFEADDLQSPEMWMPREVMFLQFQSLRNVVPYKPFNTEILG